MDLTLIDTVLIEGSNRPQFVYLEDRLIIGYRDFDLILRTGKGMPLCWRKLSYRDDIQLCYPLFDEDIDPYEFFMDLVPMGFLTIVKSYPRDCWWMILQLLHCVADTVEVFSSNPSFLVPAAQYYFFPLGDDPLKNRNISLRAGRERILKEAGLPAGEWVYGLVAQIPPEKASLELFRNLARLLAETEDLAFWKNLNITLPVFWEIIGYGMKECFIRDIIRDWRPEDLVLMIQGTALTLRDMISRRDSGEEWIKIANLNSESELIDMV